MKQKGEKGIKWHQLVDSFSTSKKIKKGFLTIKVAHVFFLLKYVSSLYLITPIGNTSHDNSVCICILSHNESDKCSGPDGFS